MQKEIFRKSQKERLKIFAKRAFKRNFYIFNEVQKICKEKKFKNILLFLPLEYEPNLLRFRHKFSKNFRLFVPFMQDKSLKMVKLRLPFEKKAFGVMESKNSLAKIKIDVAIVPVIGVDKNLRRIGHGNGFYDRFFDKLAYKPCVIFVQIINAFSQTCITQNHDIKGHFYINPKKKYMRIDNAFRTYRTYSRYSGRLGWICSCQKNK